MGDDLRRPIYLSPTKDQDLRQAIEFYSENGRYSFSHVVREMMRDGLKFRQQKPAMQQAEPYKKSDGEKNSLIPANPSQLLKKKPLSDEEIAERLAKF